MVELLIRQDADVNAETMQILNVMSRSGKTALIIAAKNGFTKIAKMLIKAGADVDAEDQ